MYLLLEKRGFTLAEVLITLAVIGIVSILTIPPLVQNYKDKQTVVKLKKAYATVSQAYAMAIAENGPIYNWSGIDGMYDINSHAVVANKLKPYLKLIYDCTGKDLDYTQKHCIGNADLYGFNSLTGPQVFSSYVLADGTTIVFRIWSKDCTYNGGTSEELKHACGQVLFILNKNAKTPEYGRDIFSFYMTRNQIIPFGTPEDSYQFSAACNKSKKHPYTGFTSVQMFACTAWVLRNENLDYWKCDDLDWGKKTKCK